MYFSHFLSLLCGLPALDTCLYPLEHAAVCTVITVSFGHRRSWTEVQYMVNKMCPVPWNCCDQSLWRYCCSQCYMTWSVSYNDQHYRKYCVAFFSTLLTHQYSVTRFSTASKITDHHYNSAVLPLSSSCTDPGFFIDHVSAWHLDPHLFLFIDHVSSCHLKWPTCMPHWLERHSSLPSPVDNCTAQLEPQ